LEAPVDETEHCILDTDLLTLTIWWQEKYGPVPALFNEAWSSQLPRFTCFADRIYRGKWIHCGKIRRIENGSLGFMSSNCGGAVANTQSVTVREPAAQRTP
jgi:hypothetical protein